MESSKTPFNIKKENNNLQRKEKLKISNQLDFLL